MLVTTLSGPCCIQHIVAFFSCSSCFLLFVLMVTILFLKQLASSGSNTLKMKKNTSQGKSYHPDLMFAICTILRQLSQSSPSTLTPVLTLSQHPVQFSM